MYKIRRWSVSQSRIMELIYNTFEPMFVLMHPLWKVMGYQRIEKPMRVLEKTIKNVLFDCQMCGHCALGSTGMSCPMNCPKSIRNGPCGGVRLNGNCEVKPEMRCVWMEAWRGSQNMRESEAIFQVQPAVNYSSKGSSSWLRVIREKNEAKQNEAQS